MLQNGVLCLDDEDLKFKNLIQNGVLCLDDEDLKFKNLIVELFNLLKF